ncbi:MAG: FKBP-type peptidyl-prolyl cis-trans isomerase [Pseudomonadota bacterium]
MIRSLLPATVLALTLPAMPVLAQSDTPTEAETPAASAPEGLTTVPQQYSYGLGLQIAQTLRSQGIMEGIEVEAFLLGLGDLLTGEEPQLTAEQVQTAYVAMQQVEAERAQAAAADNLTRGEAFLAENASAEGITVTESGLQYRVLSEGEGNSPVATDTVRVHYEGKLLSGEEFDSSYARGVPAEFGVTQVIGGWTEALQLMKPGAVWEVWLPSNLAYGERGAGGDIGPNEVLYFKIELLEVLGG